MGLVWLIAGLALFVGGHLVSTARGLRSRLVAAMGERPYKAIYSLAAFAGILLIAYGFGKYRASGWIDIWNPPPSLNHLAYLLTWFSIVMIAAAYARGHIYRKLKHPMLAGVKLWALAHLLVNGDLGSIILFGTILAWAVYDRISLKRRSDAGAPAIPVGGTMNDVIAVGAGTVVYLFLIFVFHPAVIGVSVFGS